MAMALLAATFASAEPRTFPKDVKAGKLVVFDYPTLKIGDAQFRAAPGLRVFDEGNRLLLPTQVPPSGKINYEIEASTGMVKTIWFLSPEEGAPPRQ
jgi:hypothetical protein